jgi:hypothetical protein
VVNGYTLGENGYMGGIWCGDESLKSVLNSTDAAARRVSYGEPSRRVDGTHLPQWRLAIKMEYVSWSGCVDMVW